jgi:hypothetical protein
MNKQLAIQRLREFRRYTRVPKIRRLKKKNAKSYKKGWEVRIVCVDAKNLKLARNLIKTAGFNLARYYVKGNYFIQPIYGYNNYLEMK